jgi:hypothetical protein
MIENVKIEFDTIWLKLRALHEGTEICPFRIRNGVNNLGLNDQRIETMKVGDDLLSLVHKS